MLALLLYHRALLTEIVATLYQTSAVASLFATSSHGHRRIYVIRQGLAKHDCTCREWRSLVISRRRLVIMLMSNASSKFGGIDRSMMPMCYILVCAHWIVHTGAATACFFGTVPPSTVALKESSRKLVLFYTQSLLAGLKRHTSQVCIIRSNRVS